MIATVKLIPFGVEAKLRDARSSGERRRVADRALHHQARRHRLDIAAGAGAEGGGKDPAGHRGAAGAAGATIIAERRVPHDEAALAAAIKEMLASGRNW